MYKIALSVALLLGVCSTSFAQCKDCEKKKKKTVSGHTYCVDIVCVTPRPAYVAAYRTPWHLGKNVGRGIRASRGFYVPPRWNYGYVQPYPYIDIYRPIY